MNAVFEFLKEALDVLRNSWWGTPVLRAGDSLLRRQIISMINPSASSSLEKCSDPHLFIAGAGVEFVFNVIEIVSIPVFAVMTSFIFLCVILILIMLRKDESSVKACWARLQQQNNEVIVPLRDNVLHSRIFRYQPGRQQHHNVFLSMYSETYHGDSSLNSLMNLGAYLAAQEQMLPRLMCQPRSFSDSAMNHLVTIERRTSILLQFFSVLTGLHVSPRSRNMPGMERNAHAHPQRIDNSSSLSLMSYLSENDAPGSLSLPLHGPLSKRRKRRTSVENNSNYKDRADFQTSPQPDVLQQHKRLLRMFHKSFFLSKTTKCDCCAYDTCAERPLQLAGVRENLQRPPVLLILLQRALSDILGPLKDTASSGSNLLSSSSSLLPMRCPIRWELGNCCATASSQRSLLIHSPHVAIIPSPVTTATKMTTKSETAPPEEVQIPSQTFQISAMLDFKHAHRVPCCIVCTRVPTSCQQGTPEETILSCGSTTHRVSVTGFRLLISSDRHSHDVSHALAHFIPYYCYDSFSMRKITEGGVRMRDQASIEQLLRQHPSSGSNIFNDWSAFGDNFLRFLLLVEKEPPSPFSSSLDVAISMMSGDLQQTYTFGNNNAQRAHLIFLRERMALMATQAVLKKKDRLFSEEDVNENNSAAFYVPALHLAFLGGCVEPLPAVSVSTPLTQNRGNQAQTCVTSDYDSDGTMIEHQSKDYSPSCKTSSMPGTAPAVPPVIKLSYDIIAVRSNVDDSIDDDLMHDSIICQVHVWVGIESGVVAHPHATGQSEKHIYSATRNTYSIQTNEGVFAVVRGFDFCEGQVH